MNATDNAPKSGAKKPSSTKKPAAKKPAASKAAASQPEPEAQPAPAVYAPQPMLETDARLVSMLIHLLAAVGALMSAGTLGFVAPLVLWLIYRDRSALIDHQGKQNLNLQFTVLVTGAAAWILGILLFFFGLFITLPLWGLYVLYAIIISFVAAMKSQGGEYYQMPMVIRFIK